MTSTVSITSELLSLCVPVVHRRWSMRTAWNHNLDWDLETWVQVPATALPLKLLGDKQGDTNLTLLIFEPLTNKRCLGIWAVTYLFWGHVFVFLHGGNTCLVKGSILSHIHFEWLSGGLDGCEWVHSFTAIHSPRQSFPLTHSFRITVWANWLTWIKSFTEINSHKQLFSIIRSPYIHSHKTCHGRNRTHVSRT